MVAGNNVISDASGDSTLQGTIHPDAFVFGRNHGTDVIIDFANGEDIIDLRAFVIPAFSDLTLTSDDNGVTIDLTEYGGGTILLQGIGIEDLDATDFIFSRLDGGGTSADDSLQADDDGDRVEGGDGGDTITGGDGSDLLYGGTGADTVTGGKGQDWIEGAEGDDTLFGDGGADTFVFAPGHGKDVIGDFTYGEDLIDLTAFTGISGFDDLTVTADETGVTIDLTEHGGGTIFLEGSASDDLDAEDFKFGEAADTTRRPEKANR